MKTGRLRHRGLLQRPDSQRGSRGEVLQRWIDVAVVSADIKPLRGEEFVQAQQLEATMSHRITMRYRPDVKPTWRLCYDGRLFNFVSIQNIAERRRQYDILALETVNDGTI